MERKQIANIIIPAAAVAALIALVALVLVVGGPSGTTAVTPKADDTVPVAAVADAVGMSERMPPLGGPEWKDIGNDLKVWDVKEGDGVPVKEGDKLTVHYTGWLVHGEVFDSSVRHGSPSQFQLGGVIPGWQRGIPGMKPGGIRRLYIPSELGYGSRGQGSIPPYSDLVFEVKLISSP